MLVMTAQEVPDWFKCRMEGKSCPNATHSRQLVWQVFRERKWISLCQKQDTTTKGSTALLATGSEATGPQPMPQISILNILKSKEQNTNAHKSIMFSRGQKTKVSPRGCINKMLVCLLMASVMNYLIERDCTLMEKWCRWKPLIYLFFFCSRHIKGWWVFFLRWFPHWRGFTWV